MKDAMRIADEVMAWLTAKGARPNEARFLETNSEGKLFKFSFARVHEGTKETVLVGLDETENEGDESNTVLAVELYGFDSATLVPDKPLKDQTLHRVLHFEPGAWVDVLRGALYADEFSKWERSGMNNAPA